MREGDIDEGRKKDSMKTVQRGWVSPIRQRAVTQLQQELDNCRTEFEIMRRLTPAVNRADEQAWDGMMERTYND